VDLELRLVDRLGAERVVKGPRGHSDDLDLPWADGYPLDGDSRACVAYLGQLPRSLSSHRYGYYQIVLDGLVVGGIGYHGPPRDGLVEIGYGVVPSVRNQGVATAALRRLLDMTRADLEVKRVCGRANPDNVPSQRVMLAVGMQLVGRDPDFLHYEITLQ
jgi:RimJ/RimL family protein N-acetyltransferase